jgi:hypothetical protein
MFFFIYRQELDSNHYVKVLINNKSSQNFRLPNEWILNNELTHEMLIICAIKRTESYPNSATVSKTK